MHLIITEKDTAARRIANILGNGNVKVGKIEGVNIYEFNQSVVVGLSGHILALDFPDEYKNWNEVDPQKLVTAPVVQIPAKKRIISAIKKLAKKASKITIATDYDREGELIGVEALEVIQSERKTEEIEVERVRYSAITASEIKKAFNSPARVDFNLASAAEARQKIDLIWGAALTRFISLSAKRFGKEFLSVGRVQSPLLAILVQREREIQAFKPRQYFEIKAQLKNDFEFSAKHEKGRIWDKSEAQAIIAKLGREGVIVESTREKWRDKPPSPFNTTEFLSAAAAIGFSTSTAMRIAEDLYIHGYISYPRTDNTVYPPSLNCRAIINMLLESDFNEYASTLLAKRELKPTRGKREATDHPPIHPTSPARKTELSTEYWKIYELITRRFLATFAEPAEWDVIKLAIDINQEKFLASGRKIIELGWRWFYPYQMPQEISLPMLNTGDRVRVENIELLEKQTEPPPRYTQGRLIKLMEELGLGTKSTRHEIIAKLYARGYIHGNPVKPTKTAFAVVSVLENYAQPIAKPDMTSKLEKDMDKIAEGEVEEEKVVSESRFILQSVFKDLGERKLEITNSLKQGLRADKIAGSCPRCGRELLVRKSKKGQFIGCAGYPSCEFILPLPKYGRVIIEDEKCLIHGINKVKISMKGKRSWKLGCPQCNYEAWKANADED
ncbi:MAG: DNA topoisomerase I [Methanocellales archaeon]